MKKHVILFLATNPDKVERRALDQEARAIHVELSRSGYRDRFELVTRWAAEPLDLLRELRRLKPTVVHFRGHSKWSTGSAPHCFRTVGPQGFDEYPAPEIMGHHGMSFRGMDGRSLFVSAAALQLTFDATGRCVRLVVCDTCCNEVSVSAAFPYADCVIGLQNSTPDDAARSFAIGFYGALGERESIATAYAQGCAAISLEGTPNRDKPQLWVRDGVDARQIVLAAEHRLQRRAQSCERVTVAGQADPVLRQKSNADSCSAPIVGVKQSA